MPHARRDNGDHGHDGADPEGDGDRGDRFDAPVQEREVRESDHNHHEHRLVGRDALPEVAEVVREADVSRGNLEWSAEHKLPDKQKPHEPAERLGSVPLPQVPERAARARHRRAELAPDHTVAYHNHQRDEPAEHGLGTAERGHQQRDRDERTDPDHVRHVERRRVYQAEPARHRGRRMRHGISRVKPSSPASTWVSKKSGIIAAGGPAARN